DFGGAGQQVEAVFAVEQGLTHAQPAERCTLQAARERGDAVVAQASDVHLFAIRRHRHGLRPLHAVDPAFAVPPRPVHAEAAVAGTVKQGHCVFVAGSAGDIQLGAVRRDLDVAGATDAVDTIDAVA